MNTEIMGVRPPADQKPEFPVLRATRRRVPVSSEFFQVGDVEREVLAKQMLFFLQPAPTSSADESETSGPGHLNNTDSNLSEIPTSNGDSQPSRTSKKEAQQHALDNLHVPRLHGKNPAHLFYCPVAGCKKSFSHTQDLEHHYNSVHVAACAICRKCFPTQRLLNLHVAEAHDSFFQVRKVLHRGHMNSCVFRIFWHACVYAKHSCKT